MTSKRASRRMDIDPERWRQRHEGGMLERHGDPSRSSTRESYPLGSDSATISSTPNLSAPAIASSVAPTTEASDGLQSGNIIPLSLTPTSVVTSSAAQASASVSGTSFQTHSGLGTGAIVGIAVACGVVGLAIVGLMLWFFLFRRHAQSDHVNDRFATDGRTVPRDYMMEKETHANAAESPHSPYSDDGLRDPVHDPVVVPAPPPLTQERGLLPYDNGPVQEPTPPVRTPHDGQDGTSSSPSHGVSASVAHLVEEGMTQDQIRRLEEEERALDEAIQQAGRR